MKKDCKYFNACGSTENCRRCTGYEKQQKTRFTWQQINENARQIDARRAAAGFNDYKN